MASQTNDLSALIPCQLFHAHYSKSRLSPYTRRELMSAPKLLLPTSWSWLCKHFICSFKSTCFSLNCDLHSLVSRSSYGTIQLLALCTLHSGVVQWIWLSVSLMLGCNFRSAWGSSGTTQRKWSAVFWTGPSPHGCSRWTRVHPGEPIACSTYYVHLRTKNTSLMHCHIWNA